MREVCARFYPCLYLFALLPFAAYCIPSHSTAVVVGSSAARLAGENVGNASSGHVVLVRLISLAVGHGACLTALFASFYTCDYMPPRSAKQTPLRSNNAEEDLFLRPTGPNKRPLYGIYVGLIVTLLLRLGNFSANPLWMHTSGKVMAMVMTVASVALLMTDTFFYPDPRRLDDDLVGSTHPGSEFAIPDVGHVEHPDGKMPGISHWALAAVAMGTSLFFSAWLFSSYGVIFRWVGLQPYPGGIAVVIALSLGTCVMAASVMCHASVYLSGVACAFLLTLVPVPGLSAAGGVLFAVFVPSMTYNALQSFQRQKIARSLLISQTTFMVLYAGSIATVGFDFMPGGIVVKYYGNALLLLLPLAVYGLFVGRNLVRLPTPWTKNLVPPPSVVPTLVAVVLLGLVIALPVRHTRPVRDGPNAAPDAAQPDASFAFLTYNVHQGFDTVGNANFPDLVDALSASAAHVVCLQETDTVRLHNGNRDLVEYLGGHLAFAEVYGPSTKEGTWGGALLTSLPIADDGVWFERMHSRGEYGVMLRADVHVPAGGDDAAATVRVLCTHFSLGKKERGEQAERTVELVHNSPLPLVLGGDFNSRPNSAAYAVLANGGLTDAYAATHGGTEPAGGTSYSSRETIDYIFSRTAAAANGATAGASHVRVLTDVGWISDHLPVLASNVTVA